MRNSGGVYYLYNHHLGTASLTTKSTGQLRHQARQLPYGDTRWNSRDDATDYDFTGQRRDSFDLLDFNARFYDPAIGRFISADTIVPDPANSQDWNRYSYTRNNPLNYIDPSGHDPKDPCANFNCSEGTPPPPDGTDPFYRDWAKYQADWGYNQYLTAKSWFDYYTNNPDAFWADAAKGVPSYFGIFQAEMYADRQVPGTMAGALGMSPEDTLMGAAETLNDMADPFGFNGIDGAAAGIFGWGRKLPFKSGDMIHRQYSVGQGSVEFLAEVSIKGKSLHLKDIAIYPNGAEQLDIGPREVIRLRNQLAQEAKNLGFRELRISGVRLTGANPGRNVDITVDLTK